MHAIKTRLAAMLIVLLAGMSLPGLAACGRGAPATQGAAPVIVDTDMNADDVMALSYLLQRHDIDVLAITVEGTGEAHGLAGARNALRLVRAIGGREVPVAYGPADPIEGYRSFPPAWRANADRMFGLALPAPAGPAPSQSAVRLLADTVAASARPVTIVTLGPFTNLALALRDQPAIARNIRMVYAMAGAIGVAGNEPIHHSAEWNVYVDPRAASMVLHSGARITFIPLDATNSVPITPFVLAAVAATRHTAAARIVAELLRDPYYSQNPAYFWDPLAAVVATDPLAARVRADRLVVDLTAGPTMGSTRASPAGAPALIAVSADATRFERVFLSTLDGGRPVSIPAAPASQRLRVAFDGTVFGYQGPAAVSAGRVALQLDNRSARPYDAVDIVIGRLAGGRGLADVAAVIRTGISSAPPWFQVVSVLPGPPGAGPTWGVNLAPGRYAIVGVIEGSSSRYALGELRAH